MQHVEGTEGSRGHTIVFGAIEDPATALAHALAALPAGGRLGPGIARVGPGDDPLRFNSPGWLNLRPQMASELGSHEDRVAFCDATLKSRTPLFARTLQAFLSNYIAFVRNVVETRRERLQAKLTSAGLPAEGGVLTYRDWTFSAFLPLPNAYVALPAAETFIRVDCAFWTGRRLVAIVLDGLTMPWPSQVRALAELGSAAPDVSIIRIPPRPVGDLSVFTGELHEQLSGFADGCTLPYGLFRLPILSRPGTTGIAPPRRR